MSASAPSGTSPASFIAPNSSQHAGQLVGVHVERDHVGAAAVHLERVPAGAAAHVEHPVARAQPEPVEINGQHALLLWYSSITSSYAAATFAATARQLNSSCDPLPPGGAHPRPALGVVEQRARAPARARRRRPG